jgi:hypothetical protein
MSNRPIPDPAEATFRDLRGALYSGDGHAAMSAIERRPDLDTLHYVGDGLRLALAQCVTGAARWAGEHIAGLRSRDLDGDEDLAIELERAVGGRGAFFRFKDELADVPVELARLHRSTDDRHRGRARQWLAESGLRPTVPAEPASPGHPDHPMVP